MCFRKFPIKSIKHFWYFNLEGYFTITQTQNVHKCYVKRLYEASLQGDKAFETDLHTTIEGIIHQTQTEIPISETYKVSQTMIAVQIEHGTIEDLLKRSGPDPSKTYPKI